MRKLPKDVKLLKVKFWKQQNQSRRRSIPFLLTFEEWLKIWNDSGHLHERGRGKNQYVMARFGDVGPYSIDNTKIITNEENFHEANFGRVAPLGYKFSEQSRSKMRASALGRKRSEEAKQKTSISLKKNPEFIAKALENLKLARAKRWERIM